MIGKRSPVESSVLTTTLRHQGSMSNQNITRTDLIRLKTSTRAEQLQQKVTDNKYVQMSSYAVHTLVGKGSYMPT